jgi:hypothetical protein
MGDIKDGDDFYNDDEMDSVYSVASLQLNLFKDVRPYVWDLVAFI